MKVYVERTDFNDSPKVYAESAKPVLLKNMIEDFMDGEELDDTIEQTWYNELGHFYKLMLTDEGRAKVKKIIDDCLMEKAIDRLEKDYDLVEIQE